MGPMRKSRLSRYKQDRLIEHFVAGTTARTASSLCGVNRKTAAFYFLRLREIIGLELGEESEAMFGGEIEVDESYFGGKRKGKRVTDGDRNPGRMTGGQSGMGGKADLSQLRRPILRSQAKKDHLSQVRRAI